MTASVQDAIVLLGDSLTEFGFDPHGFATKLSEVYVRKMDVINRGFGGYNTEWIVPVIEQCLATRDQQKYVQKVRILVIWFGANDAAVSPSFQHVPLPAYSANPSKLIHLVKDSSSPYYSPDTRIIIMTPPPIHPPQWINFLKALDPPQELDRFFDVTRQYADAAKAVAHEEGVPVVDVWTTIWDACGQKEDRLPDYLSDGLHLTKNGYALVFEGLTKVIRDHFPELHHENLQTTFVSFLEVPRENPRSVLTKRNAIQS